MLGSYTSATAHQARAPLLAATYYNAARGALLAKRTARQPLLHCYRKRPFEGHLFATGTAIVLISPALPQTRALRPDNNLPA